MICLADEKLIIVTSTAEKSADPTLVSFNIEVWSKATSAKLAQEAGANVFQRVKKVCETNKLKKEDIETDSYSLNPEYIYDQKTQQNRMIGFRSVQVLRVTLHKPEVLGSFLDQLTTPASKSADANSGVNINSVVWDTDKRASLEVAALGDAVRVGRTKADELAKAAGVKIKGIYQISTGIASSGPGPQNQFLRAKSSDASGTELAPGQVKVRADVTTQYEVVP
ncbi:MAG: DUF541 domain-containing protein [Proteobacteria bacterium]|nr:MAG: DUF541 domain-containing protein [Pseudomonadota bacterium]